MYVFDLTLINSTRICPARISDSSPYDEKNIISPFFFWLKCLLFLPFFINKTLTETTSAVVALIY
jgi:hypothetical protein